MTRSYAIVFVLFFAFACSEKSEQKQLLNDQQFAAAMMDIEFAREASQSAPFALRDSLFDVYLDAIAQRYTVEPEALVEEIKRRLASEEEFENIYDVLRKRLDSLGSIEEAEVSEDAE